MAQKQVDAREGLLSRKPRHKTIPKGESSGLGQKLKVRRWTSQRLNKKEKKVADKSEESRCNGVVGRDVISPAPFYLAGPEEREFD